MRAETKELMFFVLSSIWKKAASFKTRLWYLTRSSKKLFESSPCARDNEGDLDPEADADDRVSSSDVDDDFGGDEGFVASSTAISFCATGGVPLG